MDNKFSTLEGLMEFGMSLAIAQQMISTMNHCINNMAIPGVALNKPGPPINYYAVINNQQVGPLSEDELKNRIAAGSITGQTLIWYSGLSGWTMIQNIPAINQLLNRE
jgi:hypothetical protein